MNKYDASPTRGSDLKTIHRFDRIQSIRNQLTNGEELNEVNAKYFDIETMEYTPAFIDRFYRKGTKNITTETINEDHDQKVYMISKCGTW